ncbi:adenylate/guanylate cyclase domain-containing protein [Leptospira interrogans]|uniref:Adenylate cyclase n=1 Tax=Leptospira interrogans serovar Pomona TaxID=44276 RepID=A0AA41BJL3_LEPIR|nr:MULTISPECIES: adenylate/guanylate cyclase domain-containing protein [Leptospira]EJO77995.1 adenylate/guanylate cyclase catalytic domain protein [Leptospira interrogans serovar Pomona str. Kennewicki LC82-25]EKN99224.1 adenylate/guanylate cyclase catalytic domain protein [Leptospira interrogans serovar Pomona str. Pomona]EKR35526.1 adenylate/guanylate cyclase catalytic domain protein [Leptospira interrogans serovar Hebdomadis str. R499]EMF31357.1 adenylate/guanylate cyclase catalytic domain p
METLRNLISYELARYFYHHLMEELSKPEPLQIQIGYDGKTSREANRDILSRLSTEFPKIEQTEGPPFNLIREWVKRNRFFFHYDEYNFDRYNRLYIERLLALRNNTLETNSRFKEATLNNFRQFDYNRTGFSISFLIRVENNMRELMREIIFTIPNIDYNEAWQIIFEQSKDYQENVNEIFEKRLQDARDESDRLLHNILPVSIAAELKKNNRVSPVYINSATVLFTDFKGFTQISESMSPEELISNLDECFSLFDQICADHGLEKIKTIGDSFMCVGGVPEVNRTHVFDVALAALKMCDAIQKLKKEKNKNGISYWDVRIGFHTGPVAAGVIGKNKFSYDIWGDTVNIASRMESSGEPGKINVSEESYKLLSPFFTFTSRGKIAAKNKGEISMYFLEGLKPEFGTAQSHNIDFVLLN